MEKKKDGNNKNDNDKMTFNEAWECFSKTIQLFSVSSKLFFLRKQLVELSWGISIFLLRLFPTA